MAHENEGLKTPSESFYESICGSTDFMQKEASAEEGAKSLLDSLKGSDFTASQMEVLASQIDEGLSKKSSSVETELTGAEDETLSNENPSLLSKIASELTPEDYNGTEVGNAILSKFASELCAIAEAEGLDLSDEENVNGIAKLAAETIAGLMGPEDEEATDDIDDVDDGIEQMASEYDEAYEKLAAEGLSVTDYATEMCGDEQIGAYVGEYAEKLASVSGLNPLLVADDLMAKMAEYIPEE